MSIPEHVVGDKKIIDCPLCRLRSQINKKHDGYYDSIVVCGCNGTGKIIDVFMRCPHCLNGESRKLCKYCDHKGALWISEYNEINEKLNKVRYCSFESTTAHGCSEHL